MVKWQIRRRYIANMTQLLKLTNEALDSITAEDWKSAIRHMNHVIEDYMIHDKLSLDDSYDNDYVVENVELEENDHCFPQVSFKNNFVSRRKSESQPKTA